jgi:hypothetical protein
MRSCVTGCDCTPITLGPKNLLASNFLQTIGVQETPVYHAFNINLCLNPSSVRFLNFLTVSDAYQEDFT